MSKPSQSPKRRRRQKKELPQDIPKVDPLEQINMNAAGLDIGDDEIYAAVPEGRNEESVRVFGTFTAHLHVLAAAGAFRADGGFVHSPLFDAAVLRDLFQVNVLALLLRERFISMELVERMQARRGVHNGNQPPENIAILLGLMLGLISSSFAAMPFDQLFIHNNYQKI